MIFPRSNQKHRTSNRSVFFRIKPALLRYFFSFFREFVNQKCQQNRHTKAKQEHSRIFGLRKCLVSVNDRILHKKHIVDQKALKGNVSQAHQRFPAEQAGYPTHTAGKHADQHQIWQEPCENSASPWTSGAGKHEKPVAKCASFQYREQYPRCISLLQVRLQGADQHSKEHSAEVSPILAGGKMYCQ